ncbi:MAG TPA: hypothetical protein VFQ44_31315 [Streptosporangiaceae bacterium]|nr:hypothetical protein [Streptosporangiaceae bacterium]
MAVVARWASLARPTPTVVLETTPAMLGTGPRIGLGSAGRLESAGPVLARHRPVTGVSPDVGTSVRTMTRLGPAGTGWRSPAIVSIVARPVVIARPMTVAEIPRPRVVVTMRVSVGRPVLAPGAISGRTRLAWLTRLKWLTWLTRLKWLTWLTRVPCLTRVTWLSCLKWLTRVICLAGLTWLTWLAGLSCLTGLTRVKWLTPPNRLTWRPVCALIAVALLAVTVVLPVPVIPPAVLPLACLAPGARGVLLTLRLAVLLVVRLTMRMARRLALRTAGRRNRAADDRVRGP